MSADGQQDPAVQVLDAEGGPTLPIIEGGGSARAVIWPGMGASLRSMHRISLGPGGATVELRHPSDSVYYVISGDGEVGEGVEAGAQPLGEGSMVHVDAGTSYVLRGGSGGLEAVGGPAPADPALYGFVAEGA